MTNNKITIFKQKKKSLFGYLNLRFGICLEFVSWLLVISVVSSILVSGTVAAEGWQVVNSEHFLVYYVEDREFAKEVLTQAENYYRKIASDIGYDRYDKFWQWDKRVKIYIYRTHEEFLAATGKPDWTHGMARYDKKEIISYRWKSGFMRNLLPHEITHFVFRDFIGFPETGKDRGLMWMDEGVAQWEEADRRRWAEGFVKNLIGENKYMPLAELMKADMEKEKDSEFSGKFYAEAATLVGFLIEKYGGVKFSLFCRELRDGKNLNEALSFVYTGSIRDIDELESKWIEHYRK